MKSWELFGFFCLWEGRMRLQQIWVRIKRKGHVLKRNLLS